MESSREIKVVRSDFIDCHSPTCGGGLRIHCPSSKAFISDCLFLTCTAESTEYGLRGSGGGAFIFSNGSTLHRCSFQSCTGTGLGQGCYIESQESTFSCCSERLCGKIYGSYPNVICFESTVTSVDNFNTSDSQLELEFGILHVTVFIFEMKYIEAGGDSQKAHVVASSTQDSKSLIHHSHFSNYIGSSGVIYFEFVPVNIESCIFQNCKGYLPYYNYNYHCPPDKSPLKNCIIYKDQNTANAILQNCTIYNGESTSFPKCNGIMKSSIEHSNHNKVILCTLGIIN